MAVSSVYLHRNKKNPSIYPNKLSGLEKASHCPLPRLIVLKIIALVGQIENGRDKIKRL
jgi:hypothetical protein